MEYNGDNTHVEDDIFNNYVVEIYYTRYYRSRDRIDKW